jgi:hypothetical protein
MIFYNQFSWQDFERISPNNIGIYGVPEVCWSIRQTDICGNTRQTLICRTCLPAKKRRFIV